ncbi:MAG: hypothetical protein ACT6SC_06965, partial [Blastomonas fulva]
MNAQIPSSDEAGLTTVRVAAETGRIDRNGMLLHADDRLMRLHQQLGGSTSGGELAVPPLLELARHSMRLGMRLSRPVKAAGSSA